MKREDILDGESEFTMHLRYITKDQRDWFHERIKNFGFILPIIAILLLNLDNWLGYHLRGKYRLRQKRWNK
jgi:hypothetical protein